MPARFPRTTLAAAAILAACSSDQLTEPSLDGLSLAKAGAPLFSAAPGTLDFAVPPGGSAIVTATAQYVTTVTAASSSTACATVSPASMPARKPKGSSFYVATFTVTAAGEGTCTITLAEKTGKSATVQVTVTAPLPDRIVYASDVNGKSDIYVMDLDGSNPTRLTATADEWDVHPSLSADGRKVLFISSTDDSRVPTLIGVDGSGRTALPFSDASGPAALSPDGKRVAYVRVVSSRTRLFTSDLNGGNVVQLTSGTDSPTEGNPSWWGPGQGRILFTREGARNLWIMNPDGSSQFQITADDDPWHHQSIAGSLSPDGAWVAWNCQPTAHVYDVCKIKTDGTSRTQLTTSDRDDKHPRWTRDGRIVFTSTRDGNQEIYIMNADGTGQTNLTNSTANESTANLF